MFGMTPRALTHLPQKTRDDESDEENWKAKGIADVWARRNSLRSDEWAQEDEWAKRD